MENPRVPMEPNSGNSINEGKNIAIIAYLTIIGLIIAFVLNNEKRNDFATYHIRQSLGVMLGYGLSFVLYYIPFLGGILFYIGIIFFVVIWIMGVINAANGVKKPVPILGEYFNDLFSGI